MGQIITTGEEKRPRIICNNCKHQNIIDIRGWNKDVTQVGEIQCKQCHSKMYVGLLILADVTIQGLGQNVAALTEFMGSVNVLKQGKDEGPQEVN